MSTLVRACQPTWHSGTCKRCKGAVLWCMAGNTPFALQPPLNAWTAGDEFLVEGVPHWTVCRRMEA